MKHPSTLKLIPVLACILFINCNTKTTIKVEDVKMTAVQDSSQKPPPIPPPPTGLKVAAYLVYDDGTVSSFDILNDKTKALWNTTIGEGDAMKPSHKINVDLTGDLDSLEVKIKNGRKLVINKKIGRYKGGFEYVINDTGCEEVSVIIAKQKKIMYNDTIPFHCGE